MRVCESKNNNQNNPNINQNVVNNAENSKYVNTNTTNAISNSIKMKSSETENK